MTQPENTPALDRQEGGTHYKDMPIQPVAFIFANGLGFAEGNVVKYVARWKAKGGVADLKKARHYLDLLIEAQPPEPTAAAKALAHIGKVFAESP